MPEGAARGRSAGAIAPAARPDDGRKAWSITRAAPTWWARGRPAPMARDLRDPFALLERLEPTDIARDVEACDRILYGDLLLAEAGRAIYLLLH